MGYLWSSKVDPILSVGHLLEDIGIRNWALNRDAVLFALSQLAENGIAVLGGDVYTVNGASVESNYDNWYCNRDADESDAVFVERSITAARNYISNYKDPKGIALFAIVPKI